MYYLYVLKSNKDGNAYIGSTNDLERRMQEHNNGEVQSTKPRRPLELVYYEAYKAQKDARLRESKLKLKSRAYAQLRKRIEQSLTGV
jgi:putative endonuclease